MSKIWKTPVKIPEWVSVTIDDAKKYIKVVGPKWELEYTYPSVVSIEQKDALLVFNIESEEYKNYWGLVRSLVNNMIEWVYKWYEKKLLILWVWYWAKLEWKDLVLSLGFSHPIRYTIPEWITVVVDKDPKWNPLLIISGIDKQLVWQVAAKIRDYKRPEPYKWKWIRYLWEVIKMKAWKTAKK